MTDEHAPTDQETAIYDALGEGDQDAIEQMRSDAYEAGLHDQFDEDHSNAHAHYQADHEPPEDEREEATVARVEHENETA